MSDTKIEESFSKDLFCELTNEEIMKFSKNMADAEQDIRSAENSFDEMRAQQKATITSLNARMGKCASVVRSGKEIRTVKCHWELCFSEKKKVLLREDTGEIIEELPLDNSDMQADLGL